MSNILKVYGTMCLCTAASASLFASFAKWPNGMERFIWVALALSVVAFMGAVAWKD